MAQPVGQPGFAVPQPPFDCVKKKRRVVFFFFRLTRKMGEKLKKWGVCPSKMSHIFEPLPPVFCIVPSINGLKFVVQASNLTVSEK